VSFEQGLTALAEAARVASGFKGSIDAQPGSSPAVHQRTDARACPEKPSGLPVVSDPARLKVAGLGSIGTIADLQRLLVSHF
jgi:hypothetical protein